MKKVTKLFVFAIALFSLNAVIAQGTQNAKTKVKNVKPVKLTVDQKAAKNADSLKARLSLTEDQYTKVIPINVEYFKGRDALRLKMKTDTTGTTSFKTEMIALHAARKKQIAAILTPEQKKTWTAWKKTHANHDGKKMKKDDDDIDANEE